MRVCAQNMAFVDLVIFQGLRGPLSKKHHQRFLRQRHFPPPIFQLRKKIHNSRIHITGQTNILNLWTKSLETILGF